MEKQALLVRALRRRAEAGDTRIHSPYLYGNLLNSLTSMLHQKGPLRKDAISVLALLKPPSSYHVRPPVRYLCSTMYSSYSSLDPDDVLHVVSHLLELDLLQHPDELGTALILLCNHQGTLVSSKTDEITKRNIRRSITTAFSRLIPRLAPPRWEGALVDPRVNSLIAAVIALDNTDPNETQLVASVGHLVGPEKAAEYSEILLQALYRLDWIGGDAGPPVGTTMMGHDVNLLSVLCASPVEELQDIGYRVVSKGLDQWETGGCPFSPTTLLNSFIKHHRILKENQKRMAAYLLPYVGRELKANPFPPLPSLRQYQRSALQRLLSIQFSSLSLQFDHIREIPELLQAAEDMVLIADTFFANDMLECHDREEKQLTLTFLKSSQLQYCICEAFLLSQVTFLEPGPLQEIEDHFSSLDSARPYEIYSVLQLFFMTTQLSIQRNNNKEYLTKMGPVSIRLVTRAVEMVIKASMEGRSSKGIHRLLYLTLTNLQSLQHFIQRDPEQYSYLGKLEEGLVSLQDVVVDYGIRHAITLLGTGARFDYLLVEECVVQGGKRATEGMDPSSTSATDTSGEEWLREIFLHLLQKKDGFLMNTSIMAKSLQKGWLNEQEVVAVVEKQLKAINTDDYIKNLPYVERTRLLENCYFVARQAAPHFHTIRSHERVGRLVMLVTVRCCLDKLSPSTAPSLLDRKHLASRVWSLVTLFLPHPVTRIPVDKYIRICINFVTQAVTTPSPTLQETPPTLDINDFILQAFRTTPNARSRDQSLTVKRVGQYQALWLCFQRVLRQEWLHSSTPPPPLNSRAVIHLIYFFNNISHILEPHYPLDTASQLFITEVMGAILADNENAARVATGALGDAFHLVPYLIDVEVQHQLVSLALASEDVDTSLIGVLLGLREMNVER